MAGAFSSTFSPSPRPGPAWR